MSEAVVEGQEEPRSHRAIRMAAAGPWLRGGQTGSSHMFLERECGGMVKARPAHADSVAACLACAFGNSAGRALPCLPSHSFFSCRRGLRRTSAWAGGEGYQMKRG